MLKYFNEYIKPENDKLGEMLGIKHITVKDLDTPKTFKYVRAINPFGEKVYVTEETMAKCESLGLAMRRWS